MKITKMSLVAALLVGSSAFAIDNTKVSGDAKLFYDTSDTTTNDLLDQASSRGQVALDLGLTTDLTKNVSAGISTIALTSMGLESNLVAATWTGTVPTVWWVNEAWMAATAGKTTAKVGRQKLDTPLAFGETWGIAENTFDAAVLINQDIENTTLVGAWIGRGNGATGGAIVTTPTDAKDDSYSVFGGKGAYAAAVINNSWKPMTAQAWYYDVIGLANAFWVQADIEMDGGVSIGGQYATIMPVAAASDDSSAFAAKVGYAMADTGLSISAAYSQTDTKGTVDISNIATGAGKGSQTKLYTDAWWNYGYVGAADMTAFNLTAEYAVKDLADFGVYYTNASHGKTGAANRDMSDLTISASKSYGALDTSVVYINTDAKDVNGGNAFNTVQVYLTLNF